MLNLRYSALLVILLLIAASSGHAKQKTTRIVGDACDISSHKIWKEPERWAWAQICRGHIADFNDRYGELDPRNKDGWDSQRVLSSAFLERVLTTDPYRGALTRNGARIIGAWFPEAVDLEGAKVEAIIWLNKSRFDSDLSFNVTEISGVLTLEGSVIKKKLDMRSAKIGGQLSLNNAKVTGKLSMANISVASDLFMGYGAEFAEVNMIGAKVGGKLDISEAKVTGKLSMESLSVADNLHIHNSVIVQPIYAAFSSITKNLVLNGATLAGLNLTGASITESLILNGVSLAGLNLSGASIGKEFRANNVFWQEDQEPDKPALILRGATVGALNVKKWEWPQQLVLEGLVYQRLGDINIGAKSSKQSNGLGMIPTEWLALDPDATAL